MRQITLKNLQLCLLLVLFPMTSALSAPPVQHIFSNGQPADANDVNANFQELADRIEAVPTGPRGEPGVPGEPGAGIVTINRGPYGHNYSSKTFRLIRGTTEFTEVRSYDRSMPNEVVETRERFSGPDRIAYSKVYRTGGSGQDVIETLTENYDPAEPPTLTSTSIRTPALVVRKNAMQLGLAWVTAGTQVNTNVFDPENPTESTIIDRRTLLAQDSITVEGTVYSDCIQIETISNRSTNDSDSGNSVQAIQWHCAGTGLVKEIRVNHYSKSEPVFLPNSGDMLDLKYNASISVVRELISVGE